MKIQEKAHAFSRLYALLSDILLHGITEEILPVINALPGMPKV